MKKFTGFVLMVCMIVSLFAGVTTAFAAKDFKDVPSDNWAKPYVDFVVDKGYFAGATADLFKPDDNMTRGMFVAVIAKVEGLTLDNITTVDFNDVQPGKYYAGAVKWATDNGIVSGYGNGNFGPNDAITREQICVMMDKYIQYHDANNKTKYLDRKASVDFKDAADVSSWAKESVEKCVSYGLIQGFPDGKFYPKRNATRAEVAVMIYRLALVKEIIDTDEYTVSYKYESATAGKTVPSNIPVPQDANKYRTGDIVTAQEPLSPVKADGGEWTFKGWKENPITVQDKNIEFVGAWEWAEKVNDKFSVSYIAKDSTSGLDITEAVKKGLPADEKDKYKNGETVKAAEMPETIAVDKGTWEFVGFDKAGKEKTATAKIDGKDVVFTTYWKYTPKSDKFRVIYVAKEAGTNNEIEELNKRCPEPEEYAPGSIVWPKDPTNTVPYADKEGRTWTFWRNSYLLPFIMPNNDVTITQYWARESNELQVTYAYNLDNVKLLDDRTEIRKTLPNPKYEIYHIHDQVKVKQPSTTVVPKPNGTGVWTFDGFTPYDDTFEMGSSDVTLVGKWSQHAYHKLRYRNEVPDKMDSATVKKINDQASALNNNDKYYAGQKFTVKEPSTKSYVDSKTKTTWIYDDLDVKVNGKTIEPLEKDGLDYKVPTNIDGNIDSQTTLSMGNDIEVIWKWKVKPADTYKVTYTFKSTAGSGSLPKEVMDLLPKEETGKENNELVTAADPKNNTYQVDLDGETWIWRKWTYNGKETDYTTINGKDVEFVGYWEKTKTLTAHYHFVSDSGKSVDFEVAKKEPSPTYNLKSNVSFPMPDVPEKVTTEDGVWTFKGWTKDYKAKEVKYITSDKITNTTVYYGVWSYKES